LYRAPCATVALENFICHIVDQPAIANKVENKLAVRCVLIPVCQNEQRAELDPQAVDPAFLNSIDCV
jgi:hypothetical protein